MHGQTSGDRNREVRTRSPSRCGQWFEEAKTALEALDDGGDDPAQFDCEYAEDLSAVMHGTTELIRCGLKRSMKEEFTLNCGGKFLNEYTYVVHEAAVEQLQKVWENAPEHTRDKGHGGMTLENFAAIEEARQANLTHAEVAAVRLYTGPWFLQVNSALRAGQSDIVEAWATSISILISAIIKLSQLCPPELILYRTIPCRFPALAHFTGSSAAETFLERGFVSCSNDAAYTAKYSGHKQKACIIIVIQSTWSSRPAFIAPLSQYPEQNEYIFPPNTTIRFLDLEPVGCKMLVRGQPHICTMRHFTEGLRYPWSSPNDPLTASEYDAIESEANAWLDPAHARRRSLEQTKFASQARELITGAPKTAALGLEDFMGCDVVQVLSQHSSKFEAVVEEITMHGTELDRKYAATNETRVPELDRWLDYVLNQTTSEEHVASIGTRDQGRPVGMTLDDFVDTPQARSANLQREHVLALRLYTTPCFVSLNAPLRNFVHEEGKVKLPVKMAQDHPFPVTVFLIAEAIRKLRDSTGDAVVTLWRGIKDVRVADDFLRGGGVEMAPMSTSYDLATALHYSRSDRSILFKIVTRNFMERGANVAFLSAFPREQECLFPPLTYLSPTGRTQVVGPCVTIVEVTPRL